MVLVFELSVSVVDVSAEADVHLAVMDQFLRLAQLLRCESCVGGYGVTFFGQQQRPVRMVHRLIDAELLTYANLPPIFVNTDNRNTKLLHIFSNRPI